MFIRKALSKSGMTLLELIVTSGLVVVLGSLFVWFLVTTSQVTSQGSARVDIQQRAALLTRRIAKDLENSSRGAVSLYSKAQPEPFVVVVAIPLEDVDADGGRVWAQEVSGYIWSEDDQELFFRGWPPQDNPSAFAVEPLPTNYAYRLQDSELEDYAKGTGVKLAERIVDFDAKWVGEAVNLLISIEQDVAGKQAPLRFDYERVVTVRN